VPIPAHLLWAMTAIAGSRVLATEAAKRVFDRIGSARR
jgi:hypothetical protein